MILTIAGLFTVISIARLKMKNMISYYPIRHMSYRFINQVYFEMAENTGLRFSKKLLKVFLCILITVVFAKLSQKCRSLRINQKQSCLKNGFIKKTCIFFI